MRAVERSVIVALSAVFCVSCQLPSSPVRTSAARVTATSAMSAPAAAPAPATSSCWLSTRANHLVRSDGTVWVGRGANLQDTRSCGAGTAVSGQPLDDDSTGLNEVKRRIDLLTGAWKASFIRLTLESRRTQDTYTQDSNYRAIVKSIVDYIGTKPGVYVLVSIWLDPSLDTNGWPTSVTNQILTRLATDFYSYPYVMFGVSNEPQNNFDGTLDAQVWGRMNAAVAAIRTAESALGANRHIVTVQGTRDWARDLSYYVSHPITAGGGQNVAYETHVYNPAADYDALFVNPGIILPVIIGEYGPVNDQWTYASLDDMKTLMSKADAAGISHLAWTFHQYCPPNLIGEKPGMTWDQNSTDTGGIGMDLNPTDFGKLLISHLTGS